MKSVSPALKISFIFFLISFMWILFSDKLLFSLPINKEDLTALQTVKGWFYVTIVSILLYYLVKFTLSNLKKENNELEQILDSLATPIMIINENGKILKINKIFEELTEYKFEEINTIEKWAKLAYEPNEAEKVKLYIKSLYHKNEITDDGEYKLKTKSGKKIIWHFNSSPFGIENGKRRIISTALDVTKLKEKEQMIMQQSKMAAMGEVLENIAHQWRQPLSAISTAASGVKLQNELGILNDKLINDSMNMINNSAQYLSRTIDDFRGFFKPDQEKEYFKISLTFEKVMLIVGNKYQSEGINFEKNIEDIHILNYNNALLQVLINIFSNSQDAFHQNRIKEKFIYIDVFNDEYSAIIQIKDTAGGIPSRIIHKVFEPYFTTKDQSRGTGIGLYMCKEIVTKHMKGTISVQNNQFIHNNKKYTGAMFTITLPLKI